MPSAPSLHASTNSFPTRPSRLHSLTLYLYLCLLYFHVWYISEISCLSLNLYSWFDCAFSVAACTKLTPSRKPLKLSTVGGPFSPFAVAYLFSHLSVFLLQVRLYFLRLLPPNLSQRVRPDFSRALLYFQREGVRGGGGGRGDARRGLPASLWLLRKYQDEITPSFSPSPFHFPLLPSSIVDKTGLHPSRADVWEFVTFYPRQRFIYPRLDKSRLGY